MTVQVLRAPRQGVNPKHRDWDPLLLRGGWDWFPRKVSCVIPQGQLYYRVWSRERGWRFWEEGPTGAALELVPHGWITDYDACTNGGDVGDYIDPISIEGGFCIVVVAYAPEWDAHQYPTLVEKTTVYGSTQRWTLYWYRPGNKFVIENKPSTTSYAFYEYGTGSGPSRGFHVWGFQVTADEYAQQYEDGKRIYSALQSGREFGDYPSAELHVGADYNGSFPWKDSYTTGQGGILAVYMFDQPLGPQEHAQLAGDPFGPMKDHDGLAYMASAAAPQSVGISPAIATMAAQAVTASPGGRVLAINPSTGVLGAQSLSATPGAIQEGIDPALGSLLAQALVASPGGIQDTAGPALGTLLAQAVDVDLGGLSQAINPALGSFSAESLTEILGGISEAIGTALGSLTAQEVVVSAAVAEAIGASLGAFSALATPVGLGALEHPVSPSLATLTGISVSALLGGIAEGITPAAGTFSAVAVSAQPGTLQESINAATGTILAVGVLAETSGGGPVSPATGSFSAQPLTAAPGGVVVALNAATGSWVAVSASPVPGTVLVAISPAIGTLSAQAVLVDLGAIQQAVGSAEGAWEAQAVSLALGVLGVSINPATGLLEAVSLSALLGAIGMDVSPALGTWSTEAVGVVAEILVEWIYLAETIGTDVVVATADPTYLSEDDGGVLVQVEEEDILDDTSDGTHLKVST